MISQARESRSDISPISLRVNLDSTKIHGHIGPEGAANFLGLQYATIPQRFRKAQLLPLETRGNDIDGTQYGPRCPQPPNLNVALRSHLYDGLRYPSSSTLPTSELDCLNLNVYCPAPATISSQQLPVVVWIHGGGFIFGDGGSEYDGTYLVSHSIKLKQPIVLVTLNYRLGYYGFLSSRELHTEALHNEEDYCPNQGLHDQRIALQWIQQYIHHFGGNPSDVTIGGQSAGGFAALTHLLSELPLCHRGWVMSSPANPFLEEGESQQVFDRLVASTGLSLSASDAEKLACLRALTDTEMNHLIQQQFLLQPAWDPKWFTLQRSPTPIQRTKQFPARVCGLAIGWVADEVASFHKKWKAWSVEQFLDAVHEMIPDEASARAAAEVYRIGAGSHDNDASFEGFLDLASDCMYALMPFDLGNCPLPVSVYRFEQTDDFDQSVYKGYAYHCLDNAYFFRLPAIVGDQANEARKRTADSLSVAFLNFVYGEQPWEPLRQRGRVMVFKDQAGGLSEAQRHQRWLQFVDTEEQADLFAQAGLRLLQYMASLV